MSLDPQQIQFATNPPATPLLDQVGSAALKSFDDMCNNIVHGIGDKIGKCQAAIQEGLGKGAVFNVKDKGFGSGLEGAPPTTPVRSSEKSEGQAQAIAKSMVPEKVIHQAQAVGSANSMKVTEVAAADIGTFAPAATPTMGAGRSQSMSI